MDNDIYLKNMHNCKEEDQVIDAGIYNFPFLKDLFVILRNVVFFAK